MKMKPSKCSTRAAALLVLFCSLLLSTFVVAAEPPEHKFAFQNISHNLTLTPPIFAICPQDFAPIAPIGDPASTALENLAEGGDTSFLATLFEDGGCSFVAHGAPVGPGETIEVDLRGRRTHKVMVASMGLPTNDAFVAGPGKTVRELARLGWVGLRAYDAGTELNDELCSNIPGGGPCSGQGFNADRNDVVNYIHPHGGITGAGDLSPENYEWGEPIARIRRIRP